MTLVTEIAFAVLVIIAVTSLIWAVQNALLLPVKCGKNTKLWMLIDVRGDGAALEQTVKGLSWLNYNGKTKMQLVILDSGLDEEGRKAAALAARKESTIVCTAEQIIDVLK